MSEYSIELSKKLAETALDLIAYEPDNIEAKRVVIYLSRLSIELSLKAFLEKAGKPVSEIAKCWHRLSDLLEAVDLCRIYINDATDPKAFLPASEVRNIEVPFLPLLGHFTKMEFVIEAEKHGASIYPNKIRYGDNVEDVPPQTLSFAAKELTIWVEKHWNSAKYEP